MKVEGDQANVKNKDATPIAETPIAESVCSSGESC